VTRLVLVRHGRATGGWDDDPDPGLDDLGRWQAEQLAAVLAGQGPHPILVSPMRRCQETAEPLARRWGVVPVIEPLVTEIPSPDGVPEGERVPWLREALTSTWTALGPRYLAFRDSVVQRLLQCPVDTVVVSHFVAINAAIGAAVGDDRLVIRSLDNCSRTVLDVEGDRLVLVEGGAEADTLIR
jgi:broad specificity phosphatase PhoE